MGFKSSILGGIGNLIRQYIQSPNFVTGVSGWQIAQNGSAEFNNITARGNITGSTLRIPSGTSDPYIIIDTTGIRAYDSTGAVYFDLDANTPTNSELIFPPGAGTGARIVINSNGLFVYDSSNTLQLEIATANLVSGFARPLLTSIISSLSNQASIALSGTQLDIYPNYSTLNASSFVFNNSDGGFIITDTGAAISVNNPNTFKFGNGIAGGYYAEEYEQNSGQVVGSGALSNIISLTNVFRNSDYGGQFNTGTGVFTVPATGYYTLQLYAEFTAAVAGRFLVAIKTSTGTNLAQSDFTSTGSGESTSFTGQLAANTQINFAVLQASGANRTLNSNTRLRAFRHL